MWLKEKMQNILPAPKSQKFNLSFIYKIFVKTQTCVYGTKYILKPTWYNKTLDASFMQLYYKYLVELYRLFRPVQNFFTWDAISVNHLNSPGF